MQFSPSPLDSAVQTASLVASHHDSHTAPQWAVFALPNRVSRASRGTVEYIILNMYFVYMLKNSYGDLYVGITENPQQRLKYHNEKRGALFTKRDSKFQIVFLEEYLTLADARKREIQIKKWRRDKKEMLINRYKKGVSTYQ